MACVLQRRALSGELTTTQPLTHHAQVSLLPRILLSLAVPGMLQPRNLLSPALYNVLRFILPLPFTGWHFSKVEAIYFFCITIEKGHASKYSALPPQEMIS